MPILYLQIMHLHCKLSNCVRKWQYVQVYAYSAGTATENPAQGVLSTSQMLSPIAKP